MIFLKHADGMEVIWFAFKFIFIFSVALAKLEFQKGFSLICFSHFPGIIFHFFSLVLLHTPKPKLYADGLAGRFKQNSCRQLNAS